MTFDRPQLRQSILPRIQTAIRHAAAGASTSLSQVLQLLWRLIGFGLTHIQMWRLRRQVAALEIAIGRSALATGQGDLVLRRQIATVELEAKKCRIRGRSGRPLLRRLAIDVSNRVTAGETAELLQTKATKSSEIVHLSARLTEQRIGLIPSQPDKRRELLIGAAGSVGLLIIVGMLSSEFVSSDPVAAAHALGTGLSAQSTHTHTLTEVAFRDVTEQNFVSVDLETELKAAGFWLSASNVRQFVLYGSREAANKARGSEEFLPPDPGVASKVFAFTTLVETDSPGFYFFGPRHQSRYIEIKLPFRARFAQKEVQCGGDIEEAVLYSADNSEAWFLAKDGRLMRCNSPAEQAVVVRNGGILYVPEAVTTTVMLKLPEGTSREAVLNLHFRAKVILKNFRAEKPTIWGFFKVESLAKEFSRYDCEAILSAFDVGLDFGEAPAYFPSDNQAPILASAEISQIELLQDNVEIGRVTPRP